MVTTVAIAGITGKFSRLCALALLQKPDVQIHGICRDPTKVKDDLKNNSRVKIFKANWDDTTSLRKGLAGVNVAICGYLGNNTLMNEGQKILIDACISESVPRYIAGDYSIDIRKLRLGDLPSKDPMIHVAAYLEQKASQIKGVHILIGAFLETFWTFLPVWDKSIDEFEVWGTGKEKWDFTTYGTAAEYVAEVALDSDANGYLSYCVSTEELSKLFDEVYKLDAPVNIMGTFDQLYLQMHTMKLAEPENLQTWLPLYYIYYCLSGKGALTELNNNRYPQVTPTDTRRFLQMHSLDVLRKGDFF